MFVLYVCVWLINNIYLICDLIIMKIEIDQQAMIHQEVQTNEDQGNEKGLYQQMFINYHIKVWELYAKFRGKKAEQHEPYQEILPIATIYNLEEFFNYYYSIKLPSEYELNSKIMLFEKDCRPRWQDWKEGGCLIIQFKESQEAQILDEIWQFLVFSLIGNQMDKDIIGICLNKHQKQTLIQIWVKRSQNKMTISQKIAQSIRKDLEYVSKKLKKGLKVVFKEHKLSIQKGSTMKGTQFMLNIQPIKLNGQ